MQVGKLMINHRGLGVPHFGTIKCVYMTLVFSIGCFLSLKFGSPRKKRGAPSTQPHVIIIYHELLQLWAVPGQHLQGFYHFIVPVTKSWTSDVQLSSENGIPIPWVQKQVS